MEIALEKWAGRVATVSIGATKKERQAEDYSIKIGGQSTLPFLPEEGQLPNKPVVAYEILDKKPIDWPEELNRVYRDVFGDPLAWAEKCIRDYGAKILCLKLAGSHPDFGNKSPGEEAKLVAQILKKTGVPLIICGCGNDEKDNTVLPACSEAAKGQQCLIGEAVQDNYKTLTAALIADGHNIIAQSPIDINIAKQLNILISDMGLALDRIVINPTIGALGYGLEYAYSIMERSRLAALSGDKTIASPFICFVAQEAWRTKEARSNESEFPLWGNEAERGIIWETITASSLIQAGADILVMRHPKAAKNISSYIDKLATGK